MIEGAVMAYSIEEAAGMCGKGEEAFIIGGGSIYRQFMPLADRLYITHVHSKAPAEIFFPVIDLKIWKAVEKEEFSGSADFPSYTYVIYEKMISSL